MVQSKIDQSERILDLKALVAIGIGCVIGSGVMTITGAAIGCTGRSTWIAYGIAVLLGFILIFPFIILGSVLRLKGGDYTMTLVLLGKKMAGIYVLNVITMNLAISLTAVAMGIYVKSLIPAINGTAVSIVTLTFFYGINLLGIKFMSRLQTVMTIILVAALFTFCIFGLTALLPETFDIAASGYFMNGSMGLVDAVVLLVFSTTLHYQLISFGSNAIDARRDIPRAMLITTAVIFVIYVLIGLVAANVFPVEKVADQPLTYVALEILPQPLFIFFMIGGPIGAICTTLNSIFPAISKPLLQGASHGWFPRGFGKLNKYGVPYRVMTALYLVALTPILLGFDVKTITNNTVLVQYIVKFILLTAIWQMPKKYPKQWKESWMYMPNWLFYTIMVIAYIGQAFLVLISAKNLTPVIVTVSILAIVIASGIALYRDYKGKVDVTINPEDLI